MRFARLIVHVICFALLLALPLAARPTRDPKHHRQTPLVQTPFAAVVKRNEARFVLPIPPKSEWKWRLRETKNNAQEYRLDVSVENGGTKYAFGFYLWKRSGATPRSGDLSDLIAAGQASVFGRTSDGMNRIIRDAGIKLKLNGEMLVITIQGQKNVERLFSSRPPDVTFAIKVPDESPTSKTIPVTYQD